MKSIMMLVLILGLGSAVFGGTVTRQEVGPHTARGPSADPAEAASARQRTAAYELTWSLRILEEHGELATTQLVLEYEIEAFEELYVGDRLWVDDPHHRRVPEWTQ